MSCLASFQNSRVKPRKATQSAQTNQMLITAAGGEQVIRPANANRTYLTIRNLDTANLLLFGYPAQFGSIDTEGFVLKAGNAMDLESLEEIRAVAVGGDITICWDEGSG